MPPNGARAEPADRNEHDGHKGEEELRLAKESIPAQRIGARIGELWDEGYLRNSGEVPRTNLVRNRCGLAPTNDRLQI